MLSVNDAIDRLDELAGTQVAVCGLLRAEFEHLGLWHHPKAEQRIRDATGHMGSWLSLDAGDGSLRFSGVALRQLAGRRVMVMGTLRAPDPELGGCGHFSAAPAEIIVVSIDRL